MMGLMLCPFTITLAITMKTFYFKSMQVQVLPVATPTEVAAIQYCVSAGRISFTYTSLPHAALQCSPKELNAYSADFSKC